MAGSRPITEYDKLLLLIFYAHSERFQREAINKVKPRDFHPVNEIAERAIWQAITRALSCGFGKVPCMVICNELDKQDGGAVLMETSPRVKEILEAIESVKTEDINIDYALTDTLQPFLQERHLRSFIESAKGNANVEYLQSMFEEVCRSTKINPVKALTPLAPESNDLRTTWIPEPFGLDWVDELLSGGAGADELGLFLAPTGGGKTVFGLQVAIARCKLKKYVDLYLYENSLSGDISIRLLSLMTGLPRKTFVNKEIKDLPDDVKEKIRVARETYGKYLRVYDFAHGETGCNGITDIWNNTQDAAKAGEPTSLVVVDWLGAAVQKVMYGPNSKVVGGDEDIRKSINLFSQQLALMCRDLSTQGLMLHQVKADMASKIGAIINWNDGAESKGIGFWLRFALGIGKVDSNGIGRIKLSKFNNGPNDRTVTVKLNGDLNTFEPSNEAYDAASGTFQDQDVMFSLPS